MPDGGARFVLMRLAAKLPGVSLAAFPLAAMVPKLAAVMVDVPVSAATVNAFSLVPRFKSTLLNTSPVMVVSPAEAPPACRYPPFQLFRASEAKGPVVMMLPSRTLDVAAEIVAGRACAVVDGDPIDRGESIAAVGAGGDGQGGGGAGAANDDVHAALAQPDDHQRNAGAAIGGGDGDLVAVRFNSVYRCNGAPAVVAGAPEAASSIDSAARRLRRGDDVSPHQEFAKLVGRDSRRRR